MIEFDGAVVNGLDATVAARLARYLPEMERQYRDNGIPVPLAMVEAREALTAAAAAVMKTRVPPSPENSSAGAKVEKYLTVAEAAERIGWSQRYLRKLADKDRRLTGLVDEHGHQTIPKSIVDEWADRRAGREVGRLARVALAKVDGEVEALRERSARLGAEVAALEARIDAARQELAGAQELAQLALDRGDVIAEFSARETATTVTEALARIEPEHRRLDDEWSEVQRRLDPLWRQQSTVTRYDNRIAVDEGLAELLDDIRKLSARAATWNQDRRAASTPVDRSQLADVLEGLTRSPAFAAAERRIGGVDVLRRQRAEAEKARIAAPSTVSIEESQ